MYKPIKIKRIQRKELKDPPPIKQSRPTTRKEYQRQDPKIKRCQGLEKIEVIPTKTYEDYLKEALIKEPKLINYISPKIYEE